MEKENTLARLRERRGMTQREVAEELGITRQAISQWESGKAFPSMEKARALSRLYGVTVEELYQDTAARETQEMEVETETPLEPGSRPDSLPEPGCGDMPERSGPRKKPILPAVLAAVYFAVYIWGVITNSKSIAIGNLFYFTAVLLLVSLLYGAYRFILYLKGKKK